MTDYPMGTHPILDVQGESGEWRNEAYPDTATIELQALGVCEEAGELAHAVLKFKQGIRGYDYAKAQDEVADAIGDIFIYACGVADHLNINVVDAIVRTWHHVRNRNITQGSDAGTMAASLATGEIARAGDQGQLPCSCGDVGSHA